MNRRDAVKTLAVGTLSTLLPWSSALAAEPELKSAFGVELKPKPLTFSPTKLKGISERMITSHFENNYGGSVKALNAIKKRIADAVKDKDLQPNVFTELKREHLMRTGSVILHDLYFENLGGDGKVAGSIEKAIKASFGSVDAWESEFRKIGLGLAGGSGWVILGYNAHHQMLENYWAQDHMHSAPGITPLLVMDMYEHSYQIDYGAAAAKYVDAFFTNIQWSAVETRLAIK